MCGIIGQLRPRGEQVDPELLVRMCAGLEHRGPDARGIHEGGRVGLGIQRLAVIDLDTGDQPIYNEDRSVAVVLNGEIYNFQELRRDLRARGHEFRTHGDTEVIAHLYEEYGVDCVTHLEGMFAFALWDSRRELLLIARDRVGKKPLLYSFRDGVLSFASEMHALLQDTDIPREVDHAALDRYLAFGYVPAPRTAVSGVHKLPPAHTLVMRDGELTMDRYWALDYGRKLDKVPVPELCERVIDALRTATRRRLVADVPLGAFLSGGIDSSAVVAMMAELSPEPVRTFSIGFDHETHNELPHARAIAERFGTIHEEFLVRSEAVKVLPRIVRHFGEPFADSSAIPSFYLAELTRQRVTVALNGDGGDESFGGYQRYVANAVAGRLDRIPAPLRSGIAALGARLPEGGSVSSVTNRVRRLAGTLSLDSAARYTRYVSWFDDAQRAALYTPAFAAGADLGAAAAEMGVRWASTTGTSVVDRMLELDVSTYLVDDLLAKVDIATMAHGLEARSPFLDPALMQFAAEIPAELKIRGGEKKWILREALRGRLPDDLLDRPKQGFSVPLSNWLRADLLDWSSEILLDPSSLGRGYFEPAAVRRLLHRHTNGADGDAKRIWSLVMLELWHREFIDAPGAGELRAAA